MVGITNTKVTAIQGFNLSKKSWKNKYKVIYTKYKNDKKNLIKIHVWIDIKNANSLNNLMFGILLVHVWKIKFQHVPQKLKMKTRQNIIRIARPWGCSTAREEKNIKTIWKWYWGTLFLILLIFSQLSKKLHLYWKKWIDIW